MRGVCVWCVYTSSVGNEQKEERLRLLHLGVARLMVITNCVDVERSSSPLSRGPPAAELGIIIIIMLALALAGLMRNHFTEHSALNGVPSWG